MTAEQALQLVRRLLALAAPDSGAAPEEARSAALQAARLIVQHGLLDREPIDLAQVTRLALRVLQLERALAAERADRCCRGPPSGHRARPPGSVRDSAASPGTPTVEPGERVAAVVRAAEGVAAETAFRVVETAYRAMIRATESISRQRKPSRLRPWKVRVG